MEVRALQPDEQESCLDLWRTVWPNAADAYFRRYFEGDIEWLPYYTQAALDQGRVVSAVHICKRTVACGDFRLHMGGMANVATLPEYRGRGLNSACLRAAIGVMEADAMDFSLLFTGISGYYARQGYAALPRARLRGALRGPCQPLSLTVRPAQPEDLPGIFDVYAAYNATRPIAVQRNPGYWRDWIGLTPERLMRADPPLVALDPAGRIVGYVFYGFNFYQGHQITEDYAYIAEYGAASDTEVATALLGAVAERALSSGKRELHLSIALDPAIRAAMGLLCENISENVTESGMARLLNRESLLRSFLMEWNDRWQLAGRPPGEVTFETPYGPVKLDASGRFLRVQPEEGAAPTVSQSILLGLMLGSLTPEQAPINNTLMPLLQALFPSRDGIYWSADGF